MGDPKYYSNHRILIHLARLKLFSSVVYVKWSIWNTFHMSLTQKPLYKTSFMPTRQKKIEKTFDTNCSRRKLHRKLAEPLSFLRSRKQFDKKTSNPLLFYKTEQFRTKTKKLFLLVLSRYKMFPRKTTKLFFLSEAIECSLHSYSNISYSIELCWLSQEK
jgi:hypothetical protein